MKSRMDHSAAWRFGVAIFLVLLCAPAGVHAEAELNFWYWFSPADEAQLLSIIDSFEKEHGIRVASTNVLAAGGNYVEKLMIAFAGGAGPDVFFVAPGQMRAPLSDPIALDLTPYVNRDQDAIDFGDFIEAQHLELQYDGKWKCLPYDLSVFGFYYNKDMFDRAGVPYPDESWRWLDYMSHGRRLLAWDGSGQITQYAFGSWGAFEGLWGEGTYQSFGGELFAFGPDGPVSVANNSGVIRTFEVLQELVQNGLMPRPGESAGIFEGRSAITVAGSWMTINFRNTANFDFDVAMLPAADDGKRVVTASGGCWAAAAGTRYPEQAWELVKWLSSPDAIHKFVVEPIRSIPARKSVMPSWIERIQGGGLPPQNAAVFVGSVLNYGRTPSLVEFNFGGILAKYVTAIRGETMSPAEAARLLEDELNAEIQRVYAGQ